MFASEKFFFSVLVDRAGVHAILWEDKAELVRALLVLQAAIQAMEISYIAVSGEESVVDGLMNIIGARRPSPVPSDTSEIGASRFLVLMFQQATFQAIGPWLNGCRKPLSEPPGSLLVVRSADFEQFQRSAPDLSSYIGPKIFDASSMVSDFSPEIMNCLRTELPRSAIEALQGLPGEMPVADELTRWIEYSRANAE